MPRWSDLRRFLERNGKVLRAGGNHLLYLYKGNRIRISNSSSEIERGKWRRILKQQLGITQEEFNAGI